MNWESYSKERHREAWTKAGELNSLLKEEVRPSSELVEQLQTELRGYYYINGEIEKLISASMQKAQSSLNFASL